MPIAAKGQLDHHPMPQTNNLTQRAVSYLEVYFGRRPGASAWIARPGHSVYFMAPVLKGSICTEFHETFHTQFQGCLKQLIINKEKR